MRTPLIVLTFKADTLPKSVKLGSEIKYLKPYRIRPSQCNKCYRFGHWANECTRREVCVNCGIEGQHDSVDCTQPTKCSLCSQNHKANDKSCPIWVKQLEICKIRTDHQVGYGRAKTILNKKNSTQSGMSAVGKSWGPSLVESDNERVTYPNHFPKQTREYRQVLKNDRTQPICNSSFIL